MPVLELPAAFRVHTRAARVRVVGATVGEALRAVATRFPAVEPLFFTAGYELKRTVSVFVRDEDVRALAGLATPVDEDEVVVVISAIAGG